MSLKWITTLFAMCVVMGISTSTHATEFVVEALFPGKAMIKMHGKRILLKADQTKQGMTLISTDTFTQTLVLEIDGKRDTYALGRQIGGGYAKPTLTEVRINSNARGSFVSNGKINGQGVNFLLDTGASSVAINEKLAKRIGVSIPSGKSTVLVNTAAGRTEAYQVTFDQVSVGSITLYNVEGLVIKGSSPQISLLGMSFLGQLELDQRENLMVLRKKF